MPVAEDRMPSMDQYVTDITHSTRIGRLISQIL